MPFETWHRKKGMGQEKIVQAGESHPRIVRYTELKPCFDAFIDTRTPGSDKKENFTIIGPGVSENPNQHVHIAEPHGFNIGGARQPANCVNSQHSHDTAEVFYVHKGTWSFDMGETGEDARITLKPGDLISIPTNVFRGFQNIGEDIGYLWAVLGGDNPGKVLWAPDVFEMARNYGLVLLENGSLVDTGKGETVPDHVKIMSVTSDEQIAKLDVYTDAQLRGCCITADEISGVKISQGVTTRQLVGRDAKLSWAHGFEIFHNTIETGHTQPSEVLGVPDVVFVHKGELTVKVNGETWVLRSGDTATIPKNAARSFANTGTDRLEFVRVIGD